MAVDELLIGREAELTEAWVALERGGCVTLKGAPGVGKTTLARRLIRRLRASGTCVVSTMCVDQTTTLELLTSIALGAGLEVRSSDVPRVVTTQLDVQRAVVVLDGPLAGSSLVAGLVDELLLATEHVRVVVCAWRPLALALEHVIHVEPLSVEDTCALFELRGLSPSSAQQLAQASGGVPLVIELLSARVAALGLGAVLAQLEHEGLRSERLDVSVAATVATLRGGDADALAALTVFRGVFTAAHAIGLGVAAEALERLCAASLVQVHSPGRLRLLDAVRDFAERTTTSDVLDRARTRHCELLATIGRPRADDSATFTMLGELRHELLRAWKWAYSQRAVELALQLARALDPLLVTQGPGALHRDVLARTLELEGGDAVVRVDLLLSVARVDGLRGRFLSAVQWLAQAKLGAERLGDVSRQGWASAIECYCLRPLGALAEAKVAGLHALRLAREVRELTLTSMAEQALGSVAAAMGDPDEAIRAYQRAAAAARVAKAPRLLGIAYANLAALYVSMEHVDAARTLADARVAFEAAGDWFHLAQVLVDEAALAMRRDAPDVEALVAAALDATGAAGAVEGALRAHEIAVQLAKRRGDDVLAVRRLEELVVLVAQTDDVSWGARIERLRHARAVLCVSRDGRRVELDGRALDFSRRGPLRRVLLALAETSTTSLSAAQVQEAGWPGEKMFPESAAARVYMAIRRLRELGLESVLLTRDDGYVLSPQLEVRWL